MKAIFLSLIMLCSAVLCSFEATLQAEPALLKEHRITEWTLANGMKVYLKQTTSEENQVSFQLFAMGGYSGLPAADRPAAMLAPAIVWESGLHNETADHLSFHLYEQSIEIETKIQPFDRQIEGETPTSELEACFKVVNWLFTEPKFEKEGLKRAQAQARQQIQTRLKQRGTAPFATKDTFLKINSQNWDALDPLTLQGLENIDLQKAAQIYQQSFGNPAEFTLVIVGDFDLKPMKAILDKYLGSIPKKADKGLINPPLPAFPKGITKKNVFGFQRYHKAVTRLTFRIPVAITKSDIDTVEAICHLIRNRAINHFREQYNSKKKMEVNYEFPYFPRTDEAWLTIQYATVNPAEIPALTNYIFHIVEKFKAEGPTQDEIDHLRTTLTDNNLESEENYYILALIANYCRSNWELDHLFKNKDPARLEKDMLKNHFNRYLQTEQYSMITLYP